MRRVFFLTLAIGLLGQADPAVACAFCSPNARFPSLQRHLDESVHVVLAETVTPGELSIRVVLKTSGGYAKGQTLCIDSTRTAKKGDAWLVLFRANRGVPGVLALTPAAARFVTAFAELPAAEAGDTSGRVARLAFFLAEFGNRDRLVVASVGHAFAKAPYDLVKRLRPHLDVHKLALWIDEASPEHRGILYLLLAVEGSKLAKDALEAHLDGPTARARAGYDGLIGGYVLLFGKPGLDRVLSCRPPMTAASSQRVWFARCLLRALGFHLSSENVVAKDDAFAAVHELFEDPYAAGPAIGFLIAQEHWLSLDRVLALRDTWAEERPSIDRATRAFLRACPLPRAQALWVEIGKSQPTTSRASGR